MICSTCARAADRRAPRNQHCDDDKCMCGHHVNRYGKTTSAVPGPPATAPDAPSPDAQ